MQLKEKLEILLERLSDEDPAQRKFALEQMRLEVAGATSSMTSVPKPLKFLSSHYPKLKAVYEANAKSDFKVGSSSINQIFRLNWQT